jgi:hypothetical protein
MIRHQHRIAHAVAIALALTAIAAQPASAKSSPRAATGPCSEVCSDNGYGTMNRPAATPTITGSRSDAISGGGYDIPRVPPTVVRFVSGNSGFDWVDAGIGAAAMLGFMLAAIGATLLLAHRRTHSHTAS